jgi:COP9 signalosome complex subunit 7
MQHCVLQLRGTEHENQLRLLELFAYGTYANYKANQSQLPPVRPAMLDKLRMLTIVSLAQEQRIVNYSQLQQTLEVQSAHTYLAVKRNTCLQFTDVLVPYR